MPKDWILFVPRPKSIADKNDVMKNTLTGIAKNWKIQKGNKIKVAINCIEEKKGTISDILLQDPEVSLYVFGGHCSKGQSYVGWPGNDDNKLEYNKLAEQILSLGLDKNSKCKVKIYSCQSGEGEANSVGREPFAMRVASYLKSKDVKGCMYYDYPFNISQ